MSKGIHDLPLDYGRTYGHEMQIRVHAPEGTDVSSYLSVAKGLMIDLVNECESNSILHLERKHGLNDGTTITVRQSFGIQQIDIYPEGSKSGLMDVALFSFIPGENRPQAIISLDKEKTPFGKDKFKLHFDDRIKSSGVYTQDKGANGILYSINEEAPDSSYCKIPSLELPILVQHAIADSFFYYKSLCYFPKTVVGHAKKNLYAGGYLLYEADQDIIGVGEFNDLICLVTCKDNIVSFWHHLIVDIDFSSNNFDDPLIKANSFILTKELTINGGDNFTCGLCVFNLEGNKAQFDILETDVEELNEDGYIIKGSYIKHRYSIVITKNSLDVLQISSSVTTTNIVSTKELDGESLSIVSPPSSSSYAVAGAIYAFSTSELSINGEIITSSQRFCKVGPGSAEALYKQTEDWHYSNVPDPVHIYNIEIQPVGCYPEGHGAISFDYDVQTAIDADPLIGSRTHSTDTECRVVTEHKSTPAQLSPGSNIVKKRQPQEIGVFGSFSSDGDALDGGYESIEDINAIGLFAATESSYSYTINYVYVDAPLVVMDSFCNLENAASFLGGYNGRYDYSVSSKTKANFDWLLLEWGVDQIIDVDFDNYIYETAENPPDTGYRVPLANDSPFNPICHLSYVADIEYRPSPRHKLSYSGSNTYSKTYTNIFNVNLRSKLAFIYTYKENHMASLAFDQETDTDLTWCPSGDDYKNTGTKYIGLETEVGIKYIPGLDKQIGSAEQPACPSGTIMETVTPPSEPSVFNVLAEFDAKRDFPLCCHPDGYALLSANDRLMLSGNSQNDPFNVSIVLYNILEESFTDIKEMYNKALIRDKEVLLAIAGDNGSPYDLTPLQDTVISNDDITHYMTGGWGVLGRISNKSY